MANGYTLNGAQAKLTERFIETGKFSDAEHATRTAAEARTKIERACDDLIAAARKMQAMDNARGDKALADLDRIMADILLNPEIDAFSVSPEAIRSDALSAFKSAQAN